MKLLALAWHYLWARPWAAVLNLGLLTLAIAALVLLLVVGEQVQRAVQRDLAGIDLVVGAKGSPLQLILAGVFHLDVPTGNIPLAALATLRQHPLVGEAIPLSLGDSLRGWRIVGTEPAYLALYEARLAAGGLWQAPQQAVLGAAVAADLGLGLGARFVGSHGLGEGGASHAELPYTVVGLLARCACVLDRLVLTGLESVWAVHEAPELSAEDRAALAEEREVTLALLRYKSPLAAVTLPRWVNAQAGLQAAAPALESARLLRMVGVGTELLQAMAGVMGGVAALSLALALANAVREREADLAMMRMLGAPPRRLALLVAAEALWLVALGAALGLALGHGLAHLLGLVLAQQRSLAVTGAWWSPAEGWLLVGALVLALVAAALPAWRAARANVLGLLQGGRF